MDCVLFFSFYMSFYDLKWYGWQKDSEIVCLFVLFVLFIILGIFGVFKWLRCGLCVKFIEFGSLKNWEIIELIALNWHGALHLV